MSVLIAIAIVCGLAILALNLAYWSERRAMTPEERAKADEEERADMQVW